MHPVPFSNFTLSFTIYPVDKANSINNYFTSVSNIDSEPDLPDVPPLAPCELSGIVINEQEVYDQFQIVLLNFETLFAIRHHLPGGIDLSISEFCNFIMYCFLASLIISIIMKLLT
jgi:hypothetical protein